MSAIFGIYHRDGQPVQREILVRMANILDHRGTDGSGLWCAGSVGLGHRFTDARNINSSIQRINIYSFPIMVTIFYNSCYKHRILL